MDASTDNVDDAQGPFADMDIELWALVFDHVDRLSLPALFFVSRRLCGAMRHRRLVRVASANVDRGRDGESTQVWLPAYAVHHDYIVSLIEARRPAMVRWAVDEIGCAMPPGVCRRIAATGDLALLKWARVDKGCLWDTRVFCAAILSGCVDMVQWLADNECPWRPDQILDDIRVYKRITEEMLLWLFATRDRNDWAHLFARACVATDSADGTAMAHHGDAWSEIVTATATAARMGHVGALDWLWRRHLAYGISDLPALTQDFDIVSCTWDIREAEVRRDTIKWLVDHGWTYATRIVESLACCGDLQTLVWLWSHRDRSRTGDVWSGVLYRRAALHGHVCVIEWLDAVGVSWDAGSCCDAAEGGHLDVIKWAKAKGHPWRDGICDQASRGSHLDVLVWAYEKHGCPWSERAKRKALTWATKNNRLDVMRWAFARGSPITEKAIVYAMTYYGRVDMLDWIDAHATIDWPSHRFLCGEALLSGHLDTIAWLRRRGVPWAYWHALYCNISAVMRRAIVDHGCPLNSSMCAEAAKEGDLEMLMWLRARGCPWDYRVCEYAAHGSHLAVLQWAHAQKCPWTRAIEYEARDADPEILEWIARQGDRPQPTPDDDDDALNAMLANVVAYSTTMCD